jgi:peptidoglycan lytic transglycosylase D
VGRHVRAGAFAGLAFLFLAASPSSARAIDAVFRRPAFQVPALQIASAPPDATVVVPLRSKTAAGPMEPPPEPAVPMRLAPASGSAVPTMAVPPPRAERPALATMTGSPPVPYRAAAGRAPFPMSVPSRLPPLRQVSLIAPPSEKAPDLVLSPGEVDQQVSDNLQDDADEESQDPFFANASEEIEKGEDGLFAGLTNPIEKFIRYFQSKGRDRFSLYLARSGKYSELMRGILAKYGLPEDLMYLALIESGFSPKAYSSARAAGPWQFIAGTARRYGLRVDWWTDERRDAEKSTHAAASYLKDLYGMFESWPLAAAAYNAGEGKITKAVQRYKSDDYAELIRHRYLKQETKDYVPKMLAALTIAKEPEKYGFGDVEYERPLDLRTVVVPGSTDLAALARILEVPYEDIREWNPALRRFCTPPNREQYELRLSSSAAFRADQRMDDILTQAKVTFLQHNVRKKETLDKLARKYGTSVGVLKELNGLRRVSLSRVSRLVIPVTGLSDDETAPGKEIAPAQLTMAHMRAEERTRGGRHRTARRGGADSGDTVRVRRGDTLWGIAKRNGVSPGALARANHLAPGARLKIGARLALPEEGVTVRGKSSSGGRTASKSPSKVRRKSTRYKVHKGDTLEKIARVYGVEMSALAEQNRLKNADRLRAGTVLVIPQES